MRTLLLALALATILPTAAQDFVRALEGRAADNALDDDRVRVRKDDTIRKVAWRFQVPPAEVVRLNRSIIAARLGVPEGQPLDDAALERIVDDKGLVGERLRLPASRKLPSAQRARGDVSNPERWMSHARSQLGQREVPGSASNTRIREYHRVASGVEDADDLEWCGSFLNWVMDKAGLPRSRSDWARDWLDVGTPLDEPRVGAIVVVARGRGPDSGHVGLYLGPGAPGMIRVLGGNQDNQVREKEYPAADVLGYRWPGTL